MSMKTGVLEKDAQDIRRIKPDAPATGTVRAGHEKEAKAGGLEGAAKGGFLFERSLVLIALTVTFVLACESFAEVLMPSYSILGGLHRLGYFRRIPVVYEPGKGIWIYLGWTGSAMMAVMMLYSLRKRVALLSAMGSMRRWLNAHMFLGVMGPILITFHSTFKYNGIIATSFWCMIVTMVFGILGRYIYVQIPRGITGTELGIKDMESIVDDLNADIGRRVTGFNPSALPGLITAPDERAEELNPLTALFVMMSTDVKNRFRVYGLNRVLKKRYGLDREGRLELIRLLGRKAALIRRRNFLSTSHRLLHYWHVFHVPLAIVMFLIMFVHIAVYYIFSPAA